MKSRNYTASKLHQNNLLLERYTGKVIEKTQILALHLSPVHHDMEIQGFYEELGCPFLDSKTSEPVKRLTDYQINAYTLHKNHRKLLILKGQKIGLSSLFVIVTLLHALTDCQGYEIIVIAQSEAKAIQHGRDMRRILANSKYRDYLITKRMPGLLNDEITKMTEVFIHNRNDMTRPTQIHILSPSAGTIAGLKRVKMIWGSDITLMKNIGSRQKEAFIALTSRLMLTRGDVIIECPTVGPADSPVFEVSESFDEKNKAEIPIKPDEFHVVRMPVWLAVSEGLMSREAVEAEKQQYGPLFSAYFECDWFAGDQAFFHGEDWNETQEATDSFG